MSLRGAPQHSLATSLGADVVGLGAPFDNDFLAPITSRTTVVIVFDNPISDLAFTLADVDGDESLEINAYDGIGTLLETLLFKPGDPNTGDSFGTSVLFSAEGIARVEI